MQTEAAKQSYRVSFVLPAGATVTISGVPFVVTTETPVETWSGNLVFLTDDYVSLFGLESVRNDAQSSTSPTNNLEDESMNDLK
jgi:hypothetical protein